MMVRSRVTTGECGNAAPSPAPTATMSARTIGARRPRMSASPATPPRIALRFKDNAWWLRRIERLNLPGGPTTPVLLPKVVKRLIRIEAADQPGISMKFNMQGFAKGGRMQILLNERFTGDFDVHHMVFPGRMSEDNELANLPLEFRELAVVLAARRLAEGSGSTSLEMSLRADEADLMRMAHRMAQAVDRARQEPLGRRRNLTPIRYWRELDIRGY